MAQCRVELESLATAEFNRQAQHAYPFELGAEVIRTLGWRRLWEVLLEDVRRQVGPGTIAARFHQGLVQAVVQTAMALYREHAVETVVLGGGVFQNRLLLEGISGALRDSGLNVLSPGTVPANDSGLALGQAAIVAARLIRDQ